MMFVIIVSKKLRINPDNIATPIAGNLKIEKKNKTQVFLMENYQS